MSGPRRRGFRAGRTRFRAGSKYQVESLEPRTLLSSPAPLSPPGDVVTPQGADDTDDEFSEAFAATIGFTYFTDLNPATDVDMRSFTVVAGQTVGIDVDNPAGSTLDTMLRLFNSAGTEIAFSDDNAGIGPEVWIREPFIQYTFTTGGTYYAGLSGYNNRNYNPFNGGGDVAAGGTGNYYFIVYDIDPDDEIPEAPEVFTGTTLNGTLGPASTDVDVYKFFGAAGQTVDFDIDLSPSTGPPDTYLRMTYDVTSNLAVSDDDPAPGETRVLNFRESYIRHTFAQDGDYYIGVSAYPNRTYQWYGGHGDVAGNNTGGYTLTITDVDADDQISEAIAVASGGSPAGQMAPRTDVDMYAVNVLAGDEWAFDLDGNFDTYLRLFDSSGAPIFESNDAPAPGEPANTVESYIRRFFFTSGTYYLGVSGLPNYVYDPITGGRDRTGLPGSYTFNVTKVGVSPTVVGRHVFYNNSDLDGNDAGANAADDGATAAGKAGLRPGDPPGPANVTGYSKGLNGVFIDLNGLPAGVVLGPSDFSVRRTAPGVPSAWVAGTPPSQVTVRRGAGVGGSDRITLVWPDYNPQAGNPLAQAVANGWLEITVRPGSRTGLGSPDVFLLGNQLGDINGDRAVNTGDFTTLAANFGRPDRTPAQGDLNVDGRVDSSDFTLLAANFAKTLPPPPAAGLLAVSTASVTTAAASAPPRATPADDRKPSTPRARSRPPRRHVTRRLAGPGETLR